MLEATLVVYVLLQIGAAQQSGIVNPSTPFVLNNSSVQLVMENQCATKEDLEKIVNESSTGCATRQEIQQIVEDAIQAKIEPVIKLLNESEQLFYPNGSFQHPAASCKDLPQGSLSGHYWIQDVGTGYASLQYCDTARRCCNSSGGWMRVAYLDMTDPNHHCPPGFVTINSPRRTCGSPQIDGCVSATFPVHGVRYNRVCGRIKAYQYKTPDAFEYYYRFRNRGIDDPYVEGVSLTHGSSPRKHIWTFAAALDEVRSSHWVCPCTRPDLRYTGVVPPFIGQDYFCETGSRYHYQFIFYTADPLWDGQGCGSQSTCCSFNNPPWFCKQLPQPTTDDIELRLCAGLPSRDEDVPIEVVEIFVQ